MGPPSFLSGAPSTMGSGCSSEWGREYADEDSWYEWNSEYTSGPDAHLIPTGDSGLSLRLRQYRRGTKSGSASGPSSSSSSKHCPSVKERRDLRDMDRDMHDYTIASRVTSKPNIWQLKSMVESGLQSEGKPVFPLSACSYCSGGRITKHSACHYTKLKKYGGESQNRVCNKCMRFYRKFENTIIDKRKKLKACKHMNKFRSKTVRGVEKCRHTIEKCRHTISSLATNKSMLMPGSDTSLLISDTRKEDACSKDYESGYFWEKSTADDGAQMTCAFSFFENETELLVMSPPLENDNKIITDIKNRDCERNICLRDHNNTTNSLPKHDPPKAHTIVDPASGLVDRRILRTMSELPDEADVPETDDADVPETDEADACDSEESFKSENFSLLRRLSSGILTVIQPDISPRTVPDIQINDNHLSETDDTPKKPRTRRFDKTPKLALIAERLMQCNMIENEMNLAPHRRVSMDGIKVDTRNLDVGNLTARNLQPGSHFSTRRKSSPLSPSGDGNPLIPPHKVLQFTLTTNIDQIRVSTLDIKQKLRIQTYVAEFILFFICGIMFGFGGFLCVQFFYRLY